MSVWGKKQTEFFYKLTPPVIFDAVELHLDVRCTGRIQALSSMENRVYEIELENDYPISDPRRYIIVKFYRPGRWSREQILEEHDFLADLVADEIPAVAPLKFTSGSTLEEVGEDRLFFTAFPKKAGRSPDELNDTEIEQVGRLLARMHNVGQIKSFESRLPINPDTYGRANLNYLLENKHIPPEYEHQYEDLVNQICDLIDPLFSKSTSLRIHGDCHFGNLITRNQEYFWVDFDDVVTGPAVQDLWLIIPGRDARAKQQFSKLITAYNMMRPFDDNELELIEPLRALRFIHFSAWIAKRFEDPAFQRNFAHFKDSHYWLGQINDLSDQKKLILDHFSWKY